MGSAILGKVLFPPSGFSATTADDQALVVQLSVESAKILFMSDGGYATEKWFAGVRCRFAERDLDQGPTSFRQFRQ